MQSDVVHYIIRCEQCLSKASLFINHLFHIKLKQTFALDSSMIRFGHFKPLILIFVVLASVPSNESPGVNWIFLFSMTKCKTTLMICTY